MEPGLGDPRRRTACGKRNFRSRSASLGGGSTRSRVGHGVQAGEETGATYTLAQCSLSQARAPSAPVLVIVDCRRARYSLG
jgi:hypothetical protein